MNESMMYSVVIVNCHSEQLNLKGVTYVDNTPENFKYALDYMILTSPPNEIMSLYP